MTTKKKDPEVKKEIKVEDEYSNLDKPSKITKVPEIKKDDKKYVISQKPIVDQTPATAQIDSKPLLQISQENTQAMVQSLLAKSMSDAHRPRVQSPDSAVETAHILLAPSDTTLLLNEIDKEIKLGNLNSTDKYRIEMYLQGYTDLFWLRNEQDKRLLELKSKYPNSYDFEGHEELLTNVEDSLNKDGFYDVFDRASTLRRALTLATISRGSDGFERTKQVQTISQSDSTVVDKTERSPGFMERAKNWSGGFKSK